MSKTKATRVNQAKNRKGGKKGRSCIRPILDSTATRIRTAFENGQQHALTEKEQSQYTYNDNLYREYTLEDTVPTPKEGLSEEEIDKLRRVDSKWDPSIITETKVPRKVVVCIPREEERFDLLQEAHSDCQRKMVVMRHRLRTKYSWWKLQISCSNYVSTCSRCQMSQGQSDVLIPYRTVISEYPLQHLYIDLAFMVRDNKNIGVFVMVDHFTKMAWIKQISSKKAKVVEAFLIETFESIGLKELEDDEVPKFEFYLRSDNGGEFIAKAMYETCEKYGIKKKEGPAYSPWLQGVVERLNQTIKRMLFAYMESHNTSRWAAELPNVLNTYPT